MLFFYIKNSRNIIIVYIYYYLTLVKSIFCGEFIDMKKLSLYDSYFVTLDSGLYLYNSDFLDCSLIHNFNEKINSSYKVIITELYDEQKAYIICLVNEIFFIFDEYTNKTLNYNLDEFNIFKGNYYDILPYKIINDNITFFLSYNEKNKNLFFYYYTLNLYENNIILLKKTEIENMNIKNKMIRCQLINNLLLIKCFYYSLVNEQKYLSSTKFLINGTDIITNESFNLQVNKTIKQIKSSFSHDYILM